MSDERIPVLDDLRSAIRIAKAASVGVTGNGPRIARAEKAIAALAELIEAADQTLGEFDIWDDDLEEETSEASISRNNAVRAYRRLKEALAACRGGASHG